MMDAARMKGLGTIGHNIPKLLETNNKQYGVLGNGGILYRLLWMTNNSGYT